ncbi:MAG: bifunctional glycosyltransferase family 2 protein/CDP-glycerol:glycerophosphate glycerophosphotransferase [Microthrixaceae bacterium]
MIVPVHNVEGYIRQCLGSIVDQLAEGDEVIVVDDHSTDSSAELVAEIAAQHSQISVVRPDANVGLGPARNMGLASASNDYLLFLDSDDFYYPGALDAIRARCDETGADLVIFDYERVYWNDSRRRNILARMFTEYRGVFVLGDHPELLKLLNVAWNKAYRREFLLDTHLEFPPGYYEDVPFTYPILCLAQSISMLNRVCVGYRQRRGGSILRSSGDRHFELIHQIEALLEMVHERPQLERYADDLWLRAASHSLAVLAAGRSRLPKHRRAEFFHAAAKVLGPDAPSRDVLPTGGTGMKYRLLADNNYAAFQTLKFANGQRIRLRKVKRAIEPKVQPAINAVRRSRLDANLAVFSSLWDRPPSGNPLAIARALPEFAPHISPVWIVEESSVEQAGDLPHVVADSREARSLLTSAKYLVNDVNFPDRYSKVPGQIYLQTQHGTPLKFMGLDLQAYPIGAANLRFGPLMRRVDLWDYNLSSNRYSTEVWRRAFPAQHDILEYGYPRNDQLVKPPANLGEQTRARLGIPDGNLAVLYTPTHRDGVGDLELGLDAAEFVDRLGDGVTLLIRGHYFYEPSSRVRGLVEKGRIIDVSAEVQVEPLYLATDVMICDYSSAMFDFANLGRPIVIYGYDWDDYRAQRGTYFDIMAEPPGPTARTMDELVSVFEGRAYDAPDQRERLAGFQSTFCEFDDGHAAERVIRKVFLDEEPDPPVSLHGQRRPLASWELDRPA